MSWYFDRLPRTDTNVTRTDSTLDVSDESPSAPRNILSTNQTSDAISLRWEEPAKSFQNIVCYEIRYRQTRGMKLWCAVDTEMDTNSHTLGKLKSDTEYQIKVRAITDDGDEGSYSEIVNVKTPISLAQVLTRTMPDLNISDRIKRTHPKVYKLPVTEDPQQRDEALKTRKCNLGKILNCMFWWSTYEMMSLW